MIPSKLKTYYNKNFDKEIEEWLNSESINHIQQSVKEYVRQMNSVDRRIVYLSIKHGINLACEMFHITRRTLYYRLRELFKEYNKPEQYEFNDFDPIYGTDVVIDYDSIQGWADRSDH